MDPPLRVRSPNISTISAIGYSLFNPCSFQQGISCDLYLRKQATNLQLAWDALRFDLLFHLSPIYYEGVVTTTYYIAVKCVDIAQNNYL